jgi:hypothetical protein
MINSRLYEILDYDGFTKKSDAYERIQTCYKGIKGVTVFFHDGLWYIVKSKRS